jgi:predicted small metal-binding protein
MEGCHHRVPAKELAVPRFRCVDVGADCKGHFVAANNEDLIRQVSEHLQKAHKVTLPTQTLLSYISKNVK